MILVHDPPPSLAELQARVHLLSERIDWAEIRLQHLAQRLEDPT